MLKITNPITGDDLQVANHDFTDEMSWENAKRACIELGSGWRLPTKEELKAMYEQLYEKGQGNFKAALYWSSTEYGDHDAWAFFFGDGAASSADDKYGTHYVRAVRAF